MSFGILARLFGQPTRSDNRPADHEASCRHLMLGQRWDNVADMGQEDKVTEYRCQGCGQRFSPDEARALRLHDAGSATS
jgi:hypothetical protein